MHDLIDNNNEYLQNSNMIYDFLNQYLNTGKLVEISYNGVCYVNGYIVGLNCNQVKILHSLGDNKYKMIVLILEIIDCISADIEIDYNNIIPEKKNNEFNLTDYYNNNR